MSAIVCGKRSFFEDLQSPSPTSASPPVSKKIRCSSSTSPVRFPTSLIDQLRTLFPDMDNQLVEKALEESGNDLDAAIKRLHELHLVYGDAKTVADGEMDNGEKPTNGPDVQSEGPPLQNNLPADGAEWVELLVREMMSATSVDDARARATRVLESLERSISVHAGAAAAENVHKENVMLKEQIEVFLREKAIFKRAIAIQHERQKEYDDRNQEVQQLKQMIAQYQEQIKNLEVNNYALTMHLHQAQQKFFRLLAVCHTVIPEVDEVTGKVSYEAESPDEAAFVIAAREVGFEFFKRTQTNVSVHELDLESGKRIERSYKILNVLEFNSTRKRMSVIVKDEDGKILLLSKGADSIMFERLSKSGRRFEQETRDHVNEYADAGLRTLILAYRELSEEEYKTFNEKFLEAKNSVSEDREAIIDAVTDKIEKDLILLGATAVEDKLQPGVPDCIDKLAQAGIKIWVLTGDKMETAINIGYACSLLRQGMTQIIITLESPEIIAVEKSGEKNAIARASRGSVTQQITEGKALLTASSTEAFALIIDGKSLTYALDDEVKDMFLDLAIKCASVICCRSSPKQKALVTRLVKNGTGKITLAVGDGANDVGMLQEADIGVGISGVEGMQAVMSSDVAIAQFRFLERLLLVHGHWCYRRISTMICYFFYKNIVFGVTVFLYEGYASFSGQPAYNEWFLSTYNVFFTSLPVIALGVFDQDVSARLCLKFPLLYQEGIQNLLFRWRRIIGWMVNGVCSAVIIYFFCITALDPQAFKEDGKVAEFPVVGATMYTCVVWVANCQMALAISYFTLIQHIVIWGGIALWYIFLLIYGNMSSTFSTTAYKIFVEALAPSPFYWIISILTVISALIPYFAYNAIQTRFFPMYHGMIQWIRYEGRSEDPEFCHMVRQRSIRPTTVGFTARSLARRDPLEEKKEHNSSHR